MAVSYARRQQMRQLKRTALHGSRASMTLAGAAFVAYAGNATLALMLVLLTCVLMLASRRSWQLAARSRLGPYLRRKSGARSGRYEAKDGKSNTPPTGPAPATSTTSCAHLWGLAF